MANNFRNTKEYLILKAFFDNTSEGQNIIKEVLSGKKKDEKIFALSN